MREINNLKRLFSSNNLLRKEELSNVMGGYQAPPPGSCAAYCPNAGPTGTGWTLACPSSETESCIAEDGWGCEGSNGFILLCEDY